MFPTKPWIVTSSIRGSQSFAGSLRVSCPIYGGFEAEVSSLTMIASIIVSMLVDVSPAALTARTEVVVVVARAPLLGDELGLFEVHLLFGVAEGDICFLEVLDAVLLDGTPEKLPRSHLSVVQVLGLVLADVRLAVDLACDLIDDVLHAFPLALI